MGHPDVDRAEIVCYCCLMTNHDEVQRLRNLLADIYDACTDHSLGWPNFAAQDVAEMIEIAGYGRGS